jgi:hypothetical protein
MTDKPKLTGGQQHTGQHRHQHRGQAVERQAVQRPAKGRAVKTPVNSEGLTVKQEAFCMAILDGKGWSDAYREAYDAENMSAASVHREAYALATNPR